MTKEDILHHFQDINFYYNDCMMYDDLSRMLDELIDELIDDVKAEIREQQKEYQEWGWAYDDALEILDNIGKAESEDKE